MALFQLPDPTQTLGQTNAQIKGNFQTINDGFLVDHVEFSTPGEGKHKQVTFPDVSATVPTFSAGEIGLFNQSLSPAGAAPALSAYPRNEIWLTRGTGTSFPATAYAFQNAPGESRGWTYLPSGIKMIWGKARLTTAGSPVTVTFANAAANGVATFPGFVSVVGSIQISRIDSSPPVNGFGVIVSSSTTGFTFKSSSAATANKDFFWFAIGY
jgi:hypothetical protein